MGKAAAAWAAATILAAAPADRIDRAVVECLERGDDAGAAALIDTHLERHPGDAITLYNAACVRCRLGDAERGAAYLARAIKAGFSDFGHLRRDPDLRPLRGGEVFRAIVDARHAADGALAARQLERWRGLLGDTGYWYESDPQRRINFATCLDEEARSAMRIELDALEAHLEATLFRPLGGAPGRGWILVAVPAPADAATLFSRPGVQGHYSHLRREVVAEDPGRALRHEFVHALHNAHMDQLGQEHAAWTQEGLACLYEDYDLGAGTIRFVDNERQEQAAILARRGRLLPWRELAHMEPAALRGGGGAVYAQLRSMFGFIEEQAGIAAWYRACAESFDADPSGVAALEAAAGAPLEDLEGRWRAWLAR